MKKLPRPLIAIDAAGALLLTLCLGGFLWLAFMSPDAAHAERAQLHRTLDDSRRSLAGIRALHDRQRALLNARRAELARQGRLPEQPPLEEYFAELSRLAAANGLKVQSQTPLEIRHYAGLTEHCFAYEIAGPAPAILRMLQAIEESAYWADVSYLRLEESRTVAGETPGTRVAALTISIFSSPPAPEGPAGGAKP